MICLAHEDGCGIVPDAQPSITFLILLSPGRVRDHGNVENTTIIADLALKGKYGAMKHGTVNTSPVHSQACRVGK